VSEKLEVIRYYKFSSAKNSFSFEKLFELYGSISPLSKMKILEIVLGYEL